MLLHATLSCFGVGAGKPENKAAAQQVWVKRAQYNSQANLAKYSPEHEDATAKESLYVKDYKY